MAFFRLIPGPVIHSLPWFKFQKPSSPGTAAIDGILTQLWLSLPVAHTMTNYQLAFSLVLPTDDPNKTLHFYLHFKKNGRNQPTL